MRAEEHRIDAAADGEVHGVAKQDYAKVVDQCYLCDLCYMTKCPYVPPHPWNVDFPHLMLRAKAIAYGKGEVGTGEKLLTSGPGDEGPSWAASSREILFQRSSADGRTGLYRVGIDGGDPRQLTVPQDGSDPDWSGVMD